MTLAWICLGLSMLCWPLDASRRRITRLVAEGRLVGSPRTARASMESWASRASWASWASLASRVRVRLVALLLPSALGGRLVAVGGGVLAGSGTGAVAGTASGCVFGLTVAVVVGTSLTLLRGGLTRRAQIRYEDDVVLAVALLCSELEAGRTPASALEAAGPIGRDIEGMAQVDTPVSRGSPQIEALYQVASAWRMSESTGVRLAEVLARVRDDLLARMATRRAVSAAVAAPRASAALLALLPLLGIGMGAAMGAHPLTVLFGTPGGQLLLCVGTILDALGLLWTDRIIVGGQRS